MTLSRRIDTSVLAHAALALLSAVLLILVFPQFDLRILAPIALTPLLIALARTESARLRFLYGWLAGIVFWFGLCTWIQFVLEVHGGMGKFGGWGSFLLFCVLKALHLAVFSWLAGPLMWRIYALPAIAALWVGLERTHGTFGFAWLALGNAGIDMSVPLRLAPYVGVYGVSFVLMLLSVAATVVVLRYPRKYLLWLGALPLLFLVPEIPEQISPDQKALVVQPNLPTDHDWTADFLAQTQQRLSLLSQSIPSQLIIWPELPGPLYYYDDPTFHQQATQIAQKGAYFLFGTVAYTPQRAPLNSAVLLNPQGEEVSRYDKIFLVPFGEFIPPAFGWVNRITQEAGDFAPGKEIRVMQAAPNRLGVFICYESAFPHLVRQFTNRGASVLVNLSNDGYFGHSAARQQHLLLARMRAVENRRFLIRATNDGITASIDPAGRVISTIPPYEQAAKLMSFGQVTETTFYTKHGDWFAWSCLAIGLALAFHAQWASRIKRRS